MEQLQEQLQGALDVIADRLCRDIQSGIHNGPGDHYWEQINKGRGMFGHSVLAPFLVIETPEEALAFVDSGTIPAGMNDQMTMGFIDGPSVEDFLQQSGITTAASAEQLRPHIERRLSESRYEWQQPILACIAMKDFNGEGKEFPVFMASRCLDWWGTEADTIPRTGVSKAAVRELLAKQTSPLVVISSRNPWQAGKNMNVWMDVCKEMNLHVVVDTETSEGLKHLQPRHRDNMVTIPFKGSDQQTAGGRGFGNG